LIFAVAFKINAPKTAILSKDQRYAKHSSFFTPLPLLSTHRHVSLCSSTSCGAGVTRPLPIAKEVVLEIPNQSNWIWPNHFQVSKKVARSSLPIEEEEKFQIFLEYIPSFGDRLTPRTSRV
jgi:hypothetical protein